MKSLYNILRGILGRFELRTFWRLGVAHYGCYRYLRIGKIGVRLWEIKDSSPWQQRKRRNAEELEEAAFRMDPGEER